MLLLGGMILFTVLKWALKFAGVLSGALAKLMKWMLKITLFVFVIFLIGSFLSTTLR